VASSAVAEAMAAALTEALVAVTPAEAEARVGAEEPRAARVVNPLAHIARRSNRNGRCRYPIVDRISQWATRRLGSTHHSAPSQADHNHRVCNRLYGCCGSSQVRSQSSSS
jgi:hypothetical protein